MLEKDVWVLEDKVRVLESRAERLEGRVKKLESMLVQFHEISPTQLSVAKDFSRSPSSNYGSFSGEIFRNVYILPALKLGKVIIDLDGTLGYSSAFLAEAFAGLARASGRTKEQLHNDLSFKSDADPTLITEIWKYIDAEGDY